MIGNDFARSVQRPLRNARVCWHRRRRSAGKQVQIGTLTHAHRDGRQACEQAFGGSGRTSVNGTALTVEFVNQTFSSNRRRDDSALFDLVISPKAVTLAAARLFRTNNLQTLNKPPSSPQADKSAHPAAHTGPPSPPGRSDSPSCRCNHRHRSSSAWAADAADAQGGGDSPRCSRRRDTDTDRYPHDPRPPARSARAPAAAIRPDRAPAGR